jgi:zinc protease
MTFTVSASTPTALPTVEKLASGLTIVAESMPIDAVNLNIWLNVGSAIETDAINGMAHFLEHMIFKGTDHLAPGEFERLVERRGAATNAATSQDYTHYYITTAPQDFASLAPLQIDLLCNPRIADKEFQTERLVVLEEIRRSQDDPRRQVYQRSMELAFDRLPYRRPVLGPESVIADLSAQQMRYFHATHYQPKQMTVGVVGNLPVAELIDIVADSFAAQSASPPPLELAGKKISHRIEPAYHEIQRVEYVDSRLHQARLTMMWRVPGLNDLDRTYPLDVLAAILASGRTSRLVRELREELQLVSSIGVSNNSSQIQGLFYLSAQLPVEHLDRVEAIIAAQIDLLHHTPVSEAEIAKVCRQVANRYIFGTETPSDRANLYGYYQSVVGDLDPALNYPQKIQAVTPQAIQTAAQQYLSPTAYRILTVKPS